MRKKYRILKRALWSARHSPQNDLGGLLKCAREDPEFPLAKSAEKRICSIRARMLENHVREFLSLAERGAKDGDYCSFKNSLSQAKFYSVDIGGIPFKDMERITNLWINEGLEKAFRNVLIELEKSLKSEEPHIFDPLEIAGEILAKYGRHVPSHLKSEFSRLKIPVIKHDILLKLKKATECALSGNFLMMENYLANAKKLISKYSIKIPKKFFDEIALLWESVGVRIYVFNVLDNHLQKLSLGQSSLKFHELNRAKKLAKKHNIAISDILHKISEYSKK